MITRMSAQTPFGPLGAVILIALFVMPLTGCLRMNVIPKAQKGSTSALSEPRPVDHLAVPLKKNPARIYRVGPDDVLRVDVLKDLTLSQLYTITQEGNILVPNIGPVLVQDLTTEEIAQKLDEVLAKFIRDPQAKVGVQEYRSKKVYIIGQVALPGELIMHADMLTLQEAIVAAGMPTEQAALSRVQVINPALENPVVRQINVADILYKGKMAENIMLKPGDQVFVPARYTFNLVGAIRDFFAPITTVRQSLYQINSSNNSNSNSNSSNNGGRFF